MLLVCASVLCLSRCGVTDKFKTVLRIAGVEWQCVSRIFSDWIRTAHAITMPSAGNVALRRKPSIAYFDNGQWRFSALQDYSRRILEGPQSTSSGFSTKYRAPSRAPVNWGCEMDPVVVWSLGVNWVPPLRKYNTMDYLSATKSIRECCVRCSGVNSLSLVALLGVL
jgi:hypothetical protein